MKRLLLAALLAAPAAAHVISMSQGDARVNGAKLLYELRMPAYEVAHVQNPESALLDRIRFSSRGEEGKLTSRSCAMDADGVSYRCSASYQFSQPVDRLDVECRYHAVTVPNHVHLLRAENSGRKQQALFDASISATTIRFDPPTALETALTESFAGARRALGGAAQVLFLACLVVAARNRRELLLLAPAFFAGQILAALLAPAAGWTPAPRFVEAAAALTIAYLATEILLLPGAGQRWLVVSALGVFHGLYFDLFLRSTEYQAGWVLGGAVLSEAALVALFGLLIPRLFRMAEGLRPVAVSASAMLVTGMFWFFMRLRG